MSNSDHLEMLLTIKPPHATLPELRAMRLELFAELEKGLAGEKDIELSQAPDGRSLDPEIVGTIGLLLLPVVVDKLLDLLKEWGEPKREGISITIKVLDPQGGEREATFNPHYYSIDEIKRILGSMVEDARGDES